MKLSSTFKEINAIDCILIAVCAAFLIMFGTSFGVLFLCMACVLFMLLRRIDYKKHVMVKRVLISCFVLGGVLFIIVESLVISDFGDNDRKVSDADYVVVLGAGIRGTELSLTLKQRLDASLTYVKSNQNIPIIVSGGQGPGEDMTEAQAMSDYLIQNGIAQDRIILENQSTSTEENLKFSKAIIQKDGAIVHPRILIVTSDYHMFRARFIAKRMGFDTYGISSDSPLHLKPSHMTREFFAMVKVFL